MNTGDIRPFAFCISGLSESDISPRQLLRESKDLSNEAVSWKNSIVVLLSFSVMAVFLN